jgi:hypothetical protein
MNETTTSCEKKEDLNGCSQPVDNLSITCRYKTSHELISDISKRNRQKESERTKVRISKELYALAARCADFCHQETGRWIGIVALKNSPQQFPEPPKELVAAGEKSVVATVYGLHSNHEALRITVAQKCLSLLPFIPDKSGWPVEGIDYVLTPTQIKETRG